MRVKIIPSKNNYNEIIAPPSKSIAHRNVIGASLAKGRSVVKNIVLSKDIQATISCMREIGAKITYDNNTLYIDSNGLSSIDENTIVDCNESGSTLRFLIPLFAISNKEVIFKGNGRLLERPLNIYQEIFDKHGLLFKLKEDGLHIKGPLKAGVFEIKGNVSSQFITGLLMTLPLLKENSFIKVIPPFESKSYVDVTLKVLNDFGIKINVIDEYNYEIAGNQNYQSKEYYTEGDYSQIAFFAGLGLINNDLKLLGLERNSNQGDKAIIDIINSMGGLIEDDFTCKKSDLSGIDIDLADCPDLGPILMALATQADGETHIINAGRLRIKESDRIAAMEAELKKLGCEVKSSFDEIFIKGKTLLKGGVVLNSHNDHRIVMALSIISTIAQKPVVIENAESVEKSYPNFFNELKNIGIEVEIL